jgi:hypothetical protein
MRWLWCTRFFEKKFGDEKYEPDVATLSASVYAIGSEMAEREEEEEEEQQQQQQALVNCGLLRGGSCTAQHSTSRCNLFLLPTFPAKTW